MKKRKGRTVAIVAGVGVLALALLIGVYWRDIAAWAKFVYLFESIARNEQGYPEYRHRETGIVMVRLPGGTFMMGTPLHPPAETAQLRDFLDNEQHEHDVTLSSFLIAKYEVDQLTWEKVMLSNPSLRQGGSLPVHNVSWKECFEFCEKTDLSLPTEAQWEYACRAGSKAFSFGEKIDARQVLEKIAARQESLDPAGMVDAQSKQPNAFGIHHMLGNVWEWCLYHYFDKAFYERPEATLKNRKDDSLSQYRVLRGGVFRIVTIVRWEDEPRAEGFEGFRLAYYPLP